MRKAHIIKAGLLDEIQLDLVPVLLGGGVRLFDHLGAARGGEQLPDCDRQRERARLQGAVPAHKLHVERQEQQAAGHRREGQGHHRQGNAEGADLEQRQVQAAVVTSLLQPQEESHDQQSADDAARDVGAEPFLGVTAVLDAIDQ